MTNTEAIILLNTQKDKLNFDITYAQEKIDAINMAIQALKTEETGFWILHPNKRHRECSNCKVWLPIDMPRNSFCPNCSSKMEWSIYE